MEGKSIRDIFDNISLSVISFLEDQKRVTDIEFAERLGVSEVFLNNWEEEHAPYKLPEDYKAFLQISDGICLNWKIVKSSVAHHLGCMHLNKLSEVKMVTLKKFKLSAVGEEYVSSDEETDNEENKESRSKGVAAFDIDSKSQDGRVVLMYKNGNYTKPQIWFQDLSCCWFFIANSFTDYFRLMIMHLGLPHWQYVFTNVGMDPQSLQWFRYLLPDRLAIDLENRSKKLLEDEDSKKKPVKPENIKGIKRKKRRLKSKTKGVTSHNFEKFSTHSRKTVNKKANAGPNPVRPEAKKPN